MYIALNLSSGSVFLIFSNSGLNHFSNDLLLWVKHLSRNCHIINARPKILYRLRRIFAVNINLFVLHRFYWSVSLVIHFFHS